MQKKQNKVWIAFANVISCIAVIALHNNGVFHLNPEGRLWVTSSFIESIFYWAVPVFFMISGATLIDYMERYDTKTYFKKRFSRTVIPFIVWSGIGAFYWYILLHNSWNGMRDFISGIFMTRYCDVYWYFLPMFGVYLSIPLFASTDKSKRIKLFKLLIICSVILYSVMPDIFKVLGLQWNDELKVTAASGYLIYVLIGYVVANTDIKKRNRYILYLLGVVAIAVQSISIIELRKTGVEYYDFMYSYFSITEITISTAVFVLCKNIQWQKVSNKLKSSIMWLSKYSFGVYLMHYYFVQNLPRLLNFNSSSIVWRTVGVIGLYVFCIGICWVFDRVKIGRKIIGL